MSSKLTLITAISAGFLGGLGASYVRPNVAMAQQQPPEPKTVEAQSFVLLDASNNVVATFKAARPTRISKGQSVVLVDRDGRELWSAGTGFRLAH